jgi:hypothetical protein
MFIRTNPSNKVYRDLIELAFEICDEFILVVRSNINISDNLNHVLERLAPSLKQVKEQFEWTGTISYDNKPALIYYYYADSHAKEIIKQVSNSLHDWIQPELPEDLSFFKNCKHWLINTSHEHESYLLTENSEEIYKLWQIDGLDISFDT